MTIGVALLLIAAGAILRFALQTVTTHGFDLHTIGDILMAVGALGLVLSLLIWGPWTCARRSRYDRHPPADAERPSQRAEDYPPRQRPRAYQPREPSEDDYQTQEQYWR